jgi:methylmalonyl-CoA/ethylmalonyl-CoA epimerase
VITGLNHIGIAVSSLEAQLPFYRDVLGLELIGIETVSDQKVKTALLRVGEVTIELLEPTDPDSPIAAFIDQRGEGIHHLAYETDDIEGQLADMKARNIRLVDETPRPGAHGTQIAFLHPKATGRVLSELTQV